MFLGTYQPNLIGKSRIALPKKIRQEIAGERVVLTLGFENCLMGFSEKGWEEIVKPELSRPLFSDPQARDLRRQMCYEAQTVNLDAQGRLVIPQVMMDRLSIKNNLIIIGAGDHFEIWEEKNWLAYRGKLSKLKANG